MSFFAFKIFAFESLLQDICVAATVTALLIIFIKSTLISKDWWRRRESNPRPLAIHIMIYMLITFFNFMFRHRKEGIHKHELLFLFNQGN